MWGCCGFFFFFFWVVVVVVEGLVCFFLFLFCFFGFFLGFEPQLHADLWIHLFVSFKSLSPVFSFSSFISLVVIHRSSSLVRLCVCVCWGEGGTRLTPHTYIYMKWGMVLRAFIIIRNYTNHLIISVVKQTGKDKDNLTQYICRCVQHFPATTPFV